MAGKRKNKAGVMKHIQTLTYHAKETEAEGRLINLVNTYTGLDLKKNRGHKAKGIILNFLCDQLEKAIAREQHKQAKKTA